MPMKKVTEYIAQNFSYGADIQRYLKNKINTGVLLPTRTTATWDNGEISSDKKFVWEKIITYYVKQ